MSGIDELRLGYETAYVDGNVASNIAYRPQFVSNNMHKKHEKNRENDLNFPSK